MNLQTIYQVHCPHCPHVISVINPRVEELPIKVEPVSLGLGLSRRVECVDLYCDSCGKQLTVQFTFLKRRPWFG